MEFLKEAFQAVRIPIEYTCKGVDKLVDLALAKIRREIKRHDELMDAQTRVDIEDIETRKVRYNGKDLFPEINCHSLNTLPNGLQPLALGIYDESNNLNASLRVAYDKLANTPDSEISDDPVTPGWFTRWRNGAKLIQEEELIELWGKILAEEVKKPGTLSYRSLDIIKNITPEEAQLFECIAPFVVESEILPSCIINNYFFKGLLPFNAVLSLEDAGLILDSSNEIVKSIQSDCFTASAKNFNVTITDLDKTAKKQLGEFLKGYRLTTAGMEFLNFVNYKLPDDEDLQIMFTNLKHFPSCKNVKIEMYKISNEGSSVPQLLYEETIL